MSLAGPPAEDEDLVRVLRALLCGEKTPPWVNERDLYADVPEVVTADCEAAPGGGGGGDGRPAFYILTGLRSKAGGTSRTAGAGYWRMDKSCSVWPSAGEGISSSSSAPAPLGTSAALAFFAPPPNAPHGAESRTGWLMKEGVLHQAPGFALCKVYKRRTPRKAKAKAKAAAAASPFLAHLPASPPPLRLRAEIPHLLGPASPAPASSPSADGRWLIKKGLLHHGPGEPRGLAFCKAAAAAASSFLAASAQEGRLPDSPPGLRLQEEIPHRLGTPAKPASPASPAPAPSRTPDTRWLLLQMEANSSPPRLGHKLSLKRIFHFLPLDEEQLEDGEIAESIDDKKKRARKTSDLASLILEAQDIEQLNCA